MANSLRLPAAGRGLQAKLHVCFEVSLCAAGLYSWNLTALVCVCHVLGRTCAENKPFVPQSGRFGPTRKQQALMHGCGLVLVRDVVACTGGLSSSLVCVRDSLQPKDEC